MRTDTTVWFDEEAPLVRAHPLRSTASDPTPRATVSLGDAVTLFGPTGTLRATLVAALEALDDMEARQATREAMRPAAADLFTSSRPPRSGPRLEDGTP